MSRNTGLETLVGQLKRSVIDVYMKEEGWKNHGDDFYLEQIDWTERYLPVFRDQARVCVRPDEWGSGGGAVYESLDDAYRPGQGPARTYSYVAKFQEIAGRVEAAVDRWYDLPEPAEIGQAATGYATVVEQLCRGTNEQLTGEGTMVPNMTRIWDELIGHVEEGPHYGPALSDGAAETFKDYVRNLNQAVIDCGKLATGLEHYIDAQRELWAAVRSNVSAIVVSITSVCDAIVGNQRSSGAVSLQNVGVSLSVVSVVGGPIGMAATGAGLILTAIDGVTNDKLQREVEIESHAGALDLLDKLLNWSFHHFGVNEMIKTFERKTCAAITTNIQAVEAQRGIFDLVPGVIETVDGVIRHDREKADNIGRRLDSVGVELGNVASLLSGCLGELVPMVCTAYGSGILARDGRVGICGNGPTGPLVSLTDLLRMTLTELSGEVLAGAENFKAAMAVMDRVDSDTQAALTAAAQAYASSDQGGIDSFDFHPWTPVGQAETVERAARAAFGLFRGSLNGTEDTAPSMDAPPSVPIPVIDWRQMQGEWLNGDDPSDQLCAADPDDGRVTVRPQPERP